MITDAIKAALDAPLAASAVKTREQAKRTLSYIEGWHAIAEANRIFGFDGWTRETLDLQQVFPPAQSGNNWKIGYMCRVRITALGVIRDGTGFGSGAMGDLGQAVESAIKEAETDAMKRALMTFGNPFGLALYDKTQANVADDSEPAQKQLSKADSREPYKALQSKISEHTDADKLSAWWNLPETKQARAALPADWHDTLRVELADYGKKLRAASQPKELEETFA
jgi:DNA repair and recombination protein RAD52